MINGAVTQIQGEVLINISSAAIVFEQFSFWRGFWRARTIVMTGISVCIGVERHAQFILSKRQTCLHSLVPLAAITEPHSDDLFVEAQCCRHPADIMTTGLGLAGEVTLQCFL